MSSENELDGLDLMSLAGLDVSGIQGKKAGENLPRMLADFVCKEADIEAVNDEATGKVKMFLTKFKFDVLGVHKAIDDFKPEEFIGKTHTEVRVIKGMEGLEYLIGFLKQDFKIDTKGQLGEVLKRMVGISCTAVLNHRKDKDDPDRIYANLTRIKLL